MRKLITIAALVVAGAGSVLAQSTYDRQILSASVGAYPTSTVTATSTVIRGAIEEIAFSVPSVTATATVSVVSTPEVGPSVVLYTNAALTAAVRIPLRQDGVGDISTNGSHFVVLVGDTVTFTVTPVSATSNVVWKTAIKVSR
jgi:hypothetical protein